MNAAATIQRRHALRQVGKNTYTFETVRAAKARKSATVYRGAPLYRPRKAKANPMPQLWFWLGAFLACGVNRSAGVGRLAGGDVRGGIKSKEVIEQANQVQGMGRQSERDAHRLHRAR